MSWNKARWPWCGCQEALKRVGFGLADSINRRFTHCRTNDDIARAEHLAQVRTSRPPRVDASAESQLGLSTVHMHIVSEGERFPLVTLAGNNVRQIIRHHRVTDAEQSGNPLVRRSRQFCMIVQQLP